MARQHRSTVRELGARLGADEYHEWIAYDRIDHDDRTYFHAILEALAAVVSSLGNRRTAEDFLPRRRHAAPRIQSAEEGKAIFGAMVARMKAKQA